MSPAIYLVSLCCFAGFSRKWEQVEEMPWQDRCIILSSIQRKRGMPEYYNGKLFFYDWISGWIKAVTMYPNGDFEKMEPFMQSTKFNSPIDMEMGPDGRIYILGVWNRVVHQECRCGHIKN